MELLLGSPETSTPPAVPPEWRGGLTPYQPGSAARERWHRRFPEVLRGPSLCQPLEASVGPMGKRDEGSGGALGALWDPPLGQSMGTGCSLV